jgi:hypothetical protein
MCRPVNYDKQGFKQTFEFSDVGSETLFIKGHRNEHVTPLE